MDVFCQSNCTVHSQVGSGGLIMFGSLFRFDFVNPQKFPTLTNVIAPYWDSISHVTKGFIKYDVVTRNHSNLSCWLDLTSELIEEEQNVEFNATWLLVEQWIDVCPQKDRNCAEVRVDVAEFQMTSLHLLFTL